jgi:ribosome-associated translation inhibitor RaiA
MRLPPASARSAGRRVAAAKRERRATRRAKRGGKAADSGGREDRPAAITGRITPSLGRERERSPDSRKRAPVADRVPRAAKRVSGRPVTEQIPAYIRATDSVIDEADKNYLRRKLGRKLGKFARAIERISVRVEDVNGPRGGVDKSCRIKVVLSGLPSVHVEERHHAVQAAMDRALARTEHAVRQVVQRRRMQPLSQRRSEAAPAYG